MFQRTAYQYYTNVNYLTCAQCLSWHGAIRRRREAFPTPGDDCESSILQIPKKQLRTFRQQAKRMRLRAQGELSRRKLLEQAMEFLPDQIGLAVELFQRAASIDLYIPDIERLTQKHAGFLGDHPDVRDRLRTQFVKAFSDKFGWRRYERLPEVMRLQREQAGIDRINELLE